MPRLIVAALAFACGSAFAQAPPATSAPSAAYFDHTGRVPEDVLSGGVRMIPVHTSFGDFRVWTKRVGNNPRIKVLLLHGGPGATHEYLEAFDSWFPGAGIEYYYYDQLGSAYSDQPDDKRLLDLPRYVDEVEQVRAALGLDKDDFYLYGHSWGGILAIEYALRYPQHLKGLVVSNMMSSIPAYNRYAQSVLMPAMDPQQLAGIRKLEAEGRFDDPHYEELLTPFYEQHLLRKPAAQWPDPINRAFGHLNKKVYVPMQGPSELGAGGLLANWDRTADLPKIRVPTLVIGARYDTMDPAWMEKMSRLLPHGQYLYCPDAGHFAMYDDPAIYMKGVIDFLERTDRDARAASAAR